MAVRWKILLLICAASFISYVLRTNLSIVGETMIKDLGLSQIQLGLVFSAFAWGYAIFQFPGGVFGDIAGPRKAVTIIAILWGVLTIFTGMVPGREIATPAIILTVLIILRFLVGVSQAPIFPIIGGAIANWFPVSGWGLPNGLTSTALTLGAAAAAPLIVWLMEEQGWRQSFFITAPLAFLIAVVWWRYVRDQPADHASVSANELALIVKDKPPVVEQKGMWKRTLKDRNVLLLAASYFCTNYVFYLFFNWFFFYLVDVRHFEQEQAGYFTSAQWIVGAIGATVGGFLCDYFVRKYGARMGHRMVPVPSMILGALFLLFGSVESRSFLAVAMLSLSFGCTQLTEGAYWSATASVAGKHASAAGGVLNTGGNAVGGIGAVLVPVTAQIFGWPAAMITGSIFALAAALLWFFVRADVPMLEVK